MSLNIILSYADGQIYCFAGDVSQASVFVRVKALLELIDILWTQRIN
jgi:hypothetical protein